MWMKALLVAALSLSQGVTANEAARPGAPDSHAAMRRLKELVGTWETRQAGRAGTGTATYRVTGRNVVVEDMGGMMTTYYVAGQELMLTHYCGAGNQPRMRVKEIAGNRILFEMFDITNLASPSSYHTTQLEIVFRGKDRIDLDYRGTENGRPSNQMWQLTRRKS